jgi:HEAT repeat protein
MQSRKEFAARPAIALSAVCLALIVGAAQAAPKPGVGDFPSFFEQELSRFRQLAKSPLPELRVEAAQGLTALKHHAGEAILLPLVEAPEAIVRLTTTQALGVCGGRKSIPVLIHLRGDADWEVRANARAALVRMTAQNPPDETQDRWRAWLGASDWRGKEDRLIAMLKRPEVHVRQRALRAMRFIGSERCEAPLLARVRATPRLTSDEHRLVALALERVGSAASVPLLAKAATRYPEACWALGEIGGEAAEKALLNVAPRFRGRLDPLVNLDRLKSAKCEPLLPILLRSFGLVIYRSRTDDLHLPPHALQHVAANLIRRTGQAPKVVDLILAEAEGKRKDADTPALLRSLLAGMRKELGAGFVREDGLTVAQPLAALPHITRDPKLVGRLVALLEHRAFLVRIYAAMTLASLHAEPAVPAILQAIRTPYGFVDATTAASGKHFKQSQTVRWRGYLCMALGRLGGEQARLALEQIATEPTSFRDLRYGSTVGLQFLASPKSLPALRRIAKDDIIWSIRQTASEAIADIELALQQKAVLRQ